MTTNITQLHTWDLHIADADDEWEAQCGTTNPEMLTEPGAKHLPGYTLCPECLTAESEGVR